MFLMYRLKSKALKCAFFEIFDLIPTIIDLAPTNGKYVAIQDWLFILIYHKCGD